MIELEKYLLTAEEAAKALNIGRTRIYGLIKNNDLQSVKVGRSRRVVASSIETFIERRLVEQVNLGGEYMNHFD
jgi:excisionase family DNA binding protein